jgi:RimJ/RimL family protein N-acetyltransferase
LGEGIATTAIELITNYGFEDLKLIRIYAGVFEFNMASMKALENNGYKKEGIFKKAVLKNAKFLDEHRYFKLNSY